MLEDETFNEFYIKINAIWNFMINLGKNVLDAKLIKKFIKSLPERFRIKVTTIEESKDLTIRKLKSYLAPFRPMNFLSLNLRKTSQLLSNLLEKRQMTPLMRNQWMKKA
jgi:hypothetical protein